MGNSKSKGAKKGKKIISEFKNVVRKPFKVTKLAEIDDFFSKIEAPMNTLCDLSEALGKITEAILTLCDAEEIAGKVEKTVKAVLKFGKEEAKKSNNDFYLTVDENGLPSIASRSAPEGFLAKVFKAITDLVTGIRDVIEKAPALADEIKTAAESAQALPEKVPDAATSAGLNMLDQGKAVKACADNVKYLGGFPKDVLDFINSVKEFVNVLKEIFAPADQATKQESEQK